jgi:mycofactocin precursor
MEKELTIDIEGEDGIAQNAPKDPEIMEERVIEELSVDGICGVYYNVLSLSQTCSGNKRDPGIAFLFTISTYSNFC